MPKAMSLAQGAMRTTMLAIVYVVVAGAGLQLAVVHGTVSPVWPAAGFAIGAMALLGLGHWPAIAAGALFANFFFAHDPLPIAAGIAMGNTLEACLGAAVLWRFNVRGEVSSIRDGLVLVGVAILAPALSSVVGIATLTFGHLLPWHQVADAWIVWWVGNSMGALIVLPLMLAWLGRAAAPEHVARPAELVVVILTTAGLISLVFLRSTLLARIGLPAPPVAATLFPPVLWAILRFRPREALVVLAIGCLLAVLYMANRAGAHQMIGPLLGLQAMMFSMSGTTLVLLGAITDRIRTQQALIDSEQRLALALKASHTAVWELDVATQRLRPAEDALFTMIGYAPGELEHLSDWISCIHEDDRCRASRLLDEAVRGIRNGYFGEELRYQRKDGSWHWILCQMVVAARDEEGRATRLIGTHTDIDARKKAEESVREAFLHDPLTGLPNRALLSEYGDRLLAAAKRSHEQGALLFIDLDRFKPINDQFGHDVGDRVLQEVAKRLTDCTRHEDVVSRVGGDEFVVMLAHLGDGINRASVVAQHVLNSLSAPFRINGFELQTSPSIGVANYPEHGDTVDALIHASDLAMYRVKESGRANFQFYTQDLDERSKEVFSLEARIRGALKHKRLALQYQPIVDVESGKLMSAEALVRLADDGEAIGPAKFIPIAEAAGLIGELGEWVANEACRQHDEWRSQGMSLAIAINVSALQFRQRAFPDRLGSIISNARIDPQSLHVELTESAVMQNVDEAVETLNKIKSLGVKIAIDDFGTGHSSLSRLSCLPLDKLKVDQSFVHGIGTNPSGRAVTDAIIALGRNLKLDVIGEGIESRAELAYLKERGCMQAQGFLFSQPLSASEFARRYGDAALI